MGVGTAQPRQLMLSSVFCIAEDKKDPTQRKGFKMAEEQICPQIWPSALLCTATYTSTNWGANQPPLPTERTQGAGVAVLRASSAQEKGEPGASGAALSPAKRLGSRTRVLCRGEPAWELGDVPHVPGGSTRDWWIPTREAPWQGAVSVLSHIPSPRGCTVLRLRETQMRRLLPSPATSTVCIQTAGSGLLILTAAARAGSWLSTGTAGLGQAVPVCSF